jgi:hypothetical protein
VIANNQMIRRVGFDGITTPIREWLTRDGLAMLLFGLLSLFAMLPVLPHMRSQVLGWEGDNIHSSFVFGWSAQAVRTGQSPFVDSQLNYPEGLILTAAEITYVEAILMAPITWLLGPTFSYNLFLLISHWLSGYVAYLWIRSITGSRSGAMVAGIICLLSPYRIVHSYGHPSLVSTFVFTLFFWALDTTLRESPIRWRSLILLALATYLVGGTSQYYVIIALMMGAVYALCIILPKAHYLLRDAMKMAGSVVAGAILSLLPFLSNLNNDQVYTAYQLDATRVWSVDPEDYLFPSRLHPLWGTWIANIHPEEIKAGNAITFLWIEQTLYIGAITILLVIIALAWKKHIYRDYTNVWFIVALAAFIMTLGTDLHVNNQPINAAAPFWLPGYYISKIPLFNLMRVWSRFGAVVDILTGLMAGIGATLLLHRFEHLSQRRVVTSILVALITLDFLPGNYQTSRVVERPVDQWLAQQPGEFAVAPLPVNGAINYQNMFGSLFHGKHTVAFPHPNHRSQIFIDFEQQAARFPQPSSIQELQKMGFRYLLVDRSLYNWRDVQARLPLSPQLYEVAHFNTIVVFGFR